MKATIFAAIFALLTIQCLAVDPEVPLSVDLVIPNVPKVDHLLLTVRFTNRSDEPLYIIRPLDGSTDGRIAPFYRVTVTSQAGVVKPPGPFCGNYGLWAFSKWPDDYLILIPPGNTHEVPVTYYVDTPQIGMYRVSFEYVMPAKILESRFGPNLIYPDKVWRGMAVARDMAFERK